MGEHLLLTPHPIEGESISSLLIRISEKNCITVNELAGMFQSRYSRMYLYNSFQKIDCSPKKMIDMLKLSIALGIDEKRLKIHSGEVIIEKLGFDIFDFANYDFIIDCIDTYRKYCPICLDEFGFFRLEWQISEFDECDIHNSHLISRCHVCGKLLSLIPKVGNLINCQFCNADLRKAVLLKVNRGDNLLVRKKFDWRFLLNEKDVKLKNKFNMPTKQNIAFKLQQVLCENSNESHGFDTNSIKTIASGENLVSKYLRLSLVLKIIRSFNISIEDFFSI